MALLHFSNSTAALDLTKLHNEMLYSLRIGLLSYDNALSLFARWAKASTNPVTGKTSPEGPWAHYNYKLVFRVFLKLFYFIFLKYYFSRYKDGNLPFPIPYKLRPNVKDEDMRELMEREFMTKATSSEEKLVALCRWAVSYKDAYDQQKILLDEIHGDAFRFSEALSDVRRPQET